MKKSINSQITPVYRNAGFLFDTPDQLSNAFATPFDQRESDQYIYSRYDNPTVKAAEQTICQIEEAKHTLLAPSGMAAIDIALSIFQQNERESRWLFFSEIYGGTNYYIDRVLVQRRGIDAQRLLPKNEIEGYPIDYVEEALLRLRPEILYFEAVTNPMLTVSDGRSIITAARRLGIKTIIDNTFATPYLWRPLADGADIVIHSATKYLSGHGDLSAGSLSTNSTQLWSAAHDYRQLCGYMLAPDDAARLNSYMQSFECRIACHNDNAMRLAHFLIRNNTQIETVIYPGLESDKSHQIAKELFQGRGYGAVITFALKGSSQEELREITLRFVEQLRSKVDVVPTLGDAHTIMMPIAQVWGDKYPKEGVIRLSVGVEPYQKLEKIIAGALQNI